MVLLLRELRRWHFRRKLITLRKSSLNLKKLWIALKKSKIFKK